MTYDQFDTIATQLGDGARVDFKTSDGRCSNAVLLKSIRGWYFDMGSYSLVVVGPDFYPPTVSPIIHPSEIQELIIHSPEPMKTPPVLKGTIISVSGEDLEKGVCKIVINGETYEFTKKVEKEEKKVQKRWRAEKGEKYSTLGVAFDLIDKVESGDMVDDKNWKYGLYWRTEKEAIDFADKQLAITRVNDYILEHFGEWEPDWKDVYQEKWSIYYDHGQKKFNVHFYDSFEEYSPFRRLETYQQARQVIRDCGDDLEIIWGVKK